MADCENCEYKKDNGPERLKQLEDHKLLQEQKNSTTNALLTEIKDSLNEFMTEMRKETTDLKVSDSALKERSNFRMELNWKTITAFMTFVYMIIDKVF